MNEHAEVNGPLALNPLALSDLAATPQPAIAATVKSSSDSVTAKRPRGRPFTGADDPRRNAGGRPRKGESMPEKLRKRVERDADKVVDAVVKRLLRDDAVGNRAFADVRDTVYGIPKQTLVLEQGADPFAALLGELAAHRGQLVDGTAREVPAADDITTGA